MCVCPTYSIPPKNTNNPQQYWLGPNSYIGVKHLCNEQISLKCSRDHHRTRKKHMATTQLEMHKKKCQNSTTLCFKVSHCVGTPGQTLPQPSEVPPPTLPHVQKQTRVPLAAWIRVWDLSRSTAPSPYDPYGPIRKWASKKKQKQRKHLKQNLLTSNRVPFNHKFGCCCMLLPRGISEAWFLAVNTSSCS